MANDHLSAALQDTLSKRLGLAQSGRAYWLAHDLDAYHRVLLLPHENELLTAGLVSVLKENRTHLTRLAGSGHKPLACLSVTPLDLAGVVECVQVTQENVDALLALYVMYDFTDRLIIVSFDLPYGRKLRNLQKSGAAAQEALIRDILLGALHGKDA